MYIIIHLSFRIFWKWTDFQLIKVAKVDFYA